MKVPSTFILVLSTCFAGLMLAGCTEEDPSPEEAAPASSAAPAGKAPPVAASPDYSSPTALVNTLIAACAAEHKDGVSACFSIKSEGEFKPLIKQTATEEQWAEFFELFKGAKVIGAIGSDVAIKMATRDETIYTAREGTVWKVMGF